MADPKKSYNDIITWAKGTSNDIIAKQLATARTISITNNSGTALASGTFNGTGNLTLKLPATVGIDISGNAATATSATTATTATTATKLGSDAGTGKIPIYFSGGKPVACGTELSVTADKAKQLAAAKSISLTGAVTGSGNFDGSANVSITTAISASALPSNVLAGGATPKSVSLPYTATHTLEQVFVLYKVVYGDSKWMSYNSPIALNSSTVLQAGSQNTNGNSATALLYNGVTCTLLLRKGDVVSDTGGTGSYIRHPNSVKMIVLIN